MARPAGTSGPDGADLQGRHAGYSPLLMSIGPAGVTRADRPAGASARHPWRTIAVWIFVLAAAALSAKAFLGAALTTQGSFTNRPESIQAQNLTEQRLTGPAKDTELLIVRSRAITVSDPRFATFVTGLRRSVLGLGPGVVVSAPDYLTPGAVGLVAP